MIKNEVSLFISKLQNLGKEKVDKIETQINLRFLISSLQELDDLVEIYGVKSAILRQIEMLMVLLFKNEKGKFESHMLHTVFYGNPGVGKSKTAYILAKIWMALGLLNSKNLKDQMTIKELLNKIGNIRDEYIHLYDTFLVPRTKDCKSMMNYTQENWLSIRNQLISLGYADSDDKTKDKDCIVIVGREDFVAEYTGQTSIKTMNLLKSCLGKCMIIEEAYSLYTGDSDNYGMEALTVLNRFMYENSSNIIIVFTGYENKLKNSIFKAQPGLQRRCQWFYNLQGYSDEGLSQIFLKQLKKMDWIFEDEVYLKKFFEKNLASFPNFGGDTERLVFHCKLYYSNIAINNLFENRDSELNLKITNQILDKAFDEYIKNFI
jgi:hypothetical protein